MTSDLTRHCHVLHVLLSEAADGDTAICRHVDAVLIDHGCALLRSQTCEGEHADLVRDMFP